MKKGSAFDEDGELIDVNKVQTALASVGVSLLDTQGQFRDFDDVIFELADKWDTLDKNSQRYVATIAAGNRQQSRFIALVSNGKRLREVATAAEDSEDAGLIQYSKTLDSLESKQANLKTSFQQFYMGALNGDFFKGLIDSVNAVLEGFNKLSKPTAIMNIAGIISTLKMLANLGISLFSNTFGQIRTNYKSMMEEFSSIGRTTGEKTARNLHEGFQEENEKIKAEQTATDSENTVPGQQPPGQQPPITQPQQTWAQKNRGWMVAGTLIGGAASAIGSTVAQNNQRAGSVISGIGNAASTFTNAAILASSIPAIAGIAGAVPIIGGVAAALAGLISIISSWPSDLEVAQEKAQKAADDFEEKNLARAESKQKVTSLSEGIDKLKELQKNQYDSEDAQKEWLEANNSLFESLPELTVAFDSAGNAIVDITAAEDALTAARKQSAQATIAAAEKEVEKARADLDTLQAQAKENNTGLLWDEQSSIEQATSITDWYEPILQKALLEITNSETLADFNEKFGFTGTDSGASTMSFNKAAVLRRLDLYNGNDVVENWVNEHLGDSEADFIQSFLQLVKNYNTDIFNPEQNGSDNPQWFVRTSATTWEDLFSNTADLDQQIEAQVAAIKAAQTKLFAARVSSLVQNQITLDNQTPVRYSAGKAYTNLQNADTLVNSFVQQKANETALPLDEITDLQLDEWFSNATEKVRSLYETLAKSGNITDFNEITQLAEEGKYTAEQYKSELIKLFKASNFEELITSVDGLDIYTDKYLGEIQQTQHNTLEALMTHYQTYNKQTEKFDQNGNVAVQQALISLSQNVPEVFAENVIKYADTLQEQVEAGTISETQRGNLLLQQQKLWEAASAITDSVLQGQIRQILAEAEYDSTVGKMDTVEKLKDLGQTNLASMVMSIDTGAENLITAFDSLATKMSDSLDKMGDALTDAVDGLSLEDAIKAAKKAGLNLATDFQMVGDKFYVNEGTAQERINSSQVESTQLTLNALQLKNQSEQSLFSTDISKLNEEQKAQYERLKEIYQDSATQWFNDLYLTANKTLEEQSIIDNLGIDSYIQSDTELADATLNKLILNYLQSLDNGLIAAGEKYLSHKLAEQQTITIDNLVKNISNSLGSLTDSIKGTLSAADLLELQDRYSLTGQNAILSTKGYTLGQKDQQTLITSLYQSAQKSFGKLGAGEFGKQLWDTWQDAEEPLFKSYQEVEEAAEAAELAAKDIGERTDEAAKSAWDYADALRAAASAAMVAEDAYEFTFMEQDSAKGLTKNFDSFVGQIDSVQEAFKTLKAQGKDGYIGYQDFYNMMDFLETSIQRFSGGDTPANLAYLDKLFTKSGRSYEDFVNAVVANTDKWGKVNLEGIALQMGIDVETAMSAMSEGMAEGLKEVAKDQIKYLSGLEKMLQALQTLAEIGDVDLGLEFSVDINGDGVNDFKTLNEIIQNYEKLGDTEKKHLIEQLEVQLDNKDWAPNKSLQEIFGKDFTFASFFGEDFFSIDNFDVNALAALTQLGKLTSEQWQTIVQQMDVELQLEPNVDYTIDEKNEKVYTEDGYKKIWNYIQDNYQKFAVAKEAIPIDVTAQVQLNTNVEIANENIVYPENATDKEKAQINETVQKAYAKLGYDVTVDASNGHVTIIPGAADITYENVSYTSDTMPAEIKARWEKYIKTQIQGTSFDITYEDDKQAHVAIDLANTQLEITGDFDGNYEQLGQQLSEQLASKGIKIDPNVISASLEKSGGKISLSQVLGLGDFYSSIDQINNNLSTLTEAFTGDVKLNVDNTEALTNLTAVSDKLDELQGKTNLTLTVDDSNVPSSDNDKDKNVPDAKTSGNMLESLKQQGGIGLVASAAFSDVGGLRVPVEADTSSAEQEIQQSLSSTPIDVPVEIAQADNDAAYQFISSYENIITQVLNASSDAQLNLSQMFNFGDIDTSGLQQVSTSINEIAVSLQQLSGSHISIDQIGQSAQQAESKIDGLVGELQALAGRLKEISGSVSFDLDTDGISLLSNALVSLNEQGTSTITFSANGDEVKKVAEAVKGYIASVDTSHSTTFRASAGNVKSVVDQVQKLIASIKTNIPINFSGTVRISKTKSDATTAVTDGGQRTATTKFTGNVNGKALVNGQTYGAAVAGKTLVGELGPELAVYDNKYHLLGKDGAEFVDLPSDAIVFNHLQTQGIIDGKVDKIRGTQLNAAYQHATMYTGNALVEGNAFAGGAGIGAALAAVRRAKSVWQGLLNSLSAADLMNGGGGGGGGGGGKNASLKPYIADLQEWYNLSRQIVDLENRINTLVAQRNNLSKGFDQGAAYLRNLKESQALLEDQLNTQRDLYRYQQDELKRQADAINDSSNWISKFYKVGADGVLQYVEGNETNGGKGALEVLQELNDMGDNPERYTIKDQVAWIEKVTNGQFKRGFTWEEGQTEDENGKTVGNGEYTKKEWTDEEYVQEFFSALQEPIDDYDGLRDSVQETEEKLESLAEEIQKVNDEIRDNEIEVSQMIYDAIVQVKEKVIKDLKESNKLITDANKAYADSIQNAITKEKNQYSNNQNIAERETLQRQLSLLRRSGGSASEIQSLEKTISEKLKDEYFQKQEDALEVIKNANTKQTELMEQQVQLLQDTLDYEKENGVLWTKVYEIMDQGNAFMLDFLSGAGADSFLEKANLEQKKMLEEWAFKIGLYSENERSTMLSNKYAEPAFETLKNNTSDTSKWKEGYKNVYDSVDAATRTGWDRDYLDTYNSYMLKNINGQSSDEYIAAAQKEASRLAEQTFFEHIAQEKKRRDDNARATEEAKNNQSGGGSSGSSSGNSKKASGSGTSYTWKNTITGETGTASSKKAAEVAIDKSYQNVYVGAGANAAAGAKYLEEKKKASKAAIKKKVKRSRKAGGSATNTGLYMLHGTQENPEYILNAKQTRGLEQLVSFTQKNPDFVNVLKAHYDSFAGNLASQNYTTSNSNSINISDGAIQISVAKLNDSYDIEDISNDIMDRMYSIAAKSSSRSVSRR